MSGRYTEDAAVGIFGTVRGQQLSLRENTIISDTVDFLTARFSFETPEWEDLEKYALFTHNGTTWRFALDEENTVSAGCHLNLTAGEWEAAVIGEETDGDEILCRITTDAALFWVGQSGIGAGEEAPELIGSVGLRVAAEAFAARDAAEAAAETIRSLTVSTAQLPAGNTAAVTKTGGTDGAPYHLTFAFPPFGNNTVWFGTAPDTAVEGDLLAVRESAAAQPVLSKILSGGAWRPVAAVVPEAAENAVAGLPDGTLVRAADRLYLVVSAVDPVSGQTVKTRRALLPQTSSEEIRITFAGEEGDEAAFSLGPDGAEIDAPQGIALGTAGDLALSSTDGDIELTAPGGQLTFNGQEIYCAGSEARILHTAGVDAADLAASRRALERRLTNLEYAAAGYLYRTETLEGAERSRVLSGDVMPLGTLDAAGGRSGVWSQYAGPAVTETKNGVTLTPGGDGTYDLDGTATADAAFSFNAADTVRAGHKYALYLSDGIETPDSTKLRLQWNIDGGAGTMVQDGNGWKIVTAAVGGTMTGCIVVLAGHTVSHLTAAPQVIDLTALFGAGNEPEAAALGAIFPDAPYGYSAPVLFSASPAQLVSRDADDVTLSTSGLSTLAARYFPGGMRSAGTAYDELDLENKKAIRRTGMIDLGTLNYSHNGEIGENTVFLSAAGSLPDRAYTRNCICGRFSVGEISAPWNMVPRTNSDRIEFSVPTAQISRAADFKEAMDGVQLIYELAEPVVTDILEDVEDLINLPLAPGGSLTLTTDSDSAGILLPLPHRETTLIRLGGDPNEA